MANQPYVGELGAVGLAKESVLGTFVNPTRFIPVHLPCNIGSPDIDLLLSKGIRGIPDMYYKAQQGASRLKSGKMKLEVEPDNIGEILQGTFGSDVLTGAGPTYTHTFTRQAVAQLPTYSLWVSNGGLTYPEFAGCMVNSLEFDIAANAFVIADVDWIGSKFVSGGVTHALSYSTLNQFVFNQATLTVGGSSVQIYKNIKIKFDNKVKVDPVIGGAITSNVIYTEGFEVSMNASFVAENTTEWTNFLNGTAQTFVVALSGTFGGNTCSLTFTADNVFYKAAPLPLANGLIEIAFQMQAIYSTSDAFTAKVALVNDVSSQY